MALELRRPQQHALIHPGEILREEFLRPLNISASDLAEALGEPGIEGLVREESPVTSVIARALADRFGTGIEFWLNLQAHYDGHQVDSKRHVR